MLCVLVYLRSGRRGLLLAGGALLGVGVFSYTGAPPLMPLYLLLTIVALVPARAPRSAHFATITGFTLPAAFWARWVWQHPEALGPMFSHYQAVPLNASRDTSMLSLAFGRMHVDQIASLYLRFWDPRFLFREGPLRLESPFDTDTVAVFLLPMAGLLVVGILALVRRRLGASAAILLLGSFLCAPLPACLVGADASAHGRAIWRATAVVPFGVLIAAAGLDYLWTAKEPGEKRFLATISAAMPLGLLWAFTSRVSTSGFNDHVQIAATLGLLAAAVLGRKLAAVSRRVSVVTALVLVSLVALQSASFYDDYFRRVAGGRNTFRDAVAQVVEDATVGRVPAVYFADMNADRVLFYLSVAGRTDLSAKMVPASEGPLDLERLRGLPERSLVVTPVGSGPVDRAIRAMERDGEVRVERFIREADGTPTYWVLQRVSRS
jgi:hypothetical protein